MYNWSPVKNLILFFVCISCQSSFAESIEKRVDLENYKEAKLLIKLGKFNKAVINLEEELSKGTKNEVIYYLLGKAYSGLNRNSQGLIYYKKSLEINPTYSKSYSGMALIKGKQKKVKETLNLLNKAIEYDPNYASAYSNRGVAKGALQDTEGALEDFDNAINLNPKLSDAYRNRGITRELLGDIIGACSDWKVASALGQDTPKTWIKETCNETPDMKIAQQNKLINVLQEKADKLELILNNQKETKINKETQINNAEQAPIALLPTITDLDHEKSKPIINASKVFNPPKTSSDKSISDPSKYPIISKNSLQNIEPNPNITTPEVVALSKNQLKTVYVNNNWQIILFVFICMSLVVTNYFIYKQSFSVQKLLDKSIEKKEKIQSSFSNINKNSNKIINRLLTRIKKIFNWIKFNLIAISTNLFKNKKSIVF